MDAESVLATITFVEPMYPVARRELPEGPDWQYEVKIDGYRCIAAHDSSGVKLWSRPRKFTDLSVPTYR